MTPLGQSLRQAGMGTAPFPEGSLGMGVPFLGPELTNTQQSPGFQVFIPSTQKNDNPAILPFLSSPGPGATSSN